MIVAVAATPLHTGREAVPWARQYPDGKQGGVERLPDDRVAGSTRPSDLGILRASNRDEQAAQGDAKGDSMWRRHLSADRVLMLLLGISLCINVAIVVLALNREPVRAPADVIQGDVLAAITGISGRGETRTIRFDGLTKPIVLYVFSETCTWCQRNRSAISALFRAASDRFEFIGVSLGPVRDPTATLSLGVEFPTLTPTGRLPFLSTPQTVVVDQGGEVIRAWRGAYVGRIHSAIEQYFDVILPASDVR